MGDGKLRALDRAIRDREGFIDELLGPEGGPLARRVLLAYLGCTALYGVCMGSFNGLFSFDGIRYALASMVKVPLLFLLTTLIVLPALHVSNTLLGATKLSLRQTALLFLSAMSVTALMLAACAPILIFFTLCTSSYTFIKLFNVLIFTVSGLYGLVFLFRGVHHLKLLEGSSVGIMRLWVIVWALVGAQMAWILRPFIGAQGLPFTLFREQESNFYLNVLQSIGRLMGG